MGKYVQHRLDAFPDRCGGQQREQGCQFRTAVAAGQGKSDGMVKLAALDSGAFACLAQRGASVVHLAADGRLLGVLVVSDPIKSTTPEALAALRAAGLRVVLNDRHVGAATTEVQ